jgi:transposase InsO family protein
MACGPTICGAPTTKANFNSATSGIDHVTDHASRYLLLCEALESNREELALRAFDRLFRERGLPQAIHSDNGVPFASPYSLFQLSKHSVWWLLLGISIERIRPGHPQQNGRHERMHLTLKKQATRPAVSSAALYASSRPYLGIREPHYPFHDKTVLVTCWGRLCLHRKKINFRKSWAGRAVV